MDSWGSTTKKKKTHWWEEGLIIQKWISTSAGAYYVVLFPPPPPSLSFVCHGFYCNYLKYFQTGFKMCLISKEYKCVVSSQLWSASREVAAVPRWWWGLAQLSLQTEALPSSHLRITPCSALLVEASEVGSRQLSLASATVALNNARRPDHLPSP